MEPFCLLLVPSGPKPNQYIQMNHSAVPVKKTITGGSSAMVNELSL
jgi:hypothetical protein